MERKAESPKAIKKREREKQVVGDMIALYCRKQHGTAKGELCRDCEELLAYARQRSDQCPFMETKSFCSSCKRHCYGSAQREQIKRVMRFSGPRMLLVHPWTAVRHAFTVLGGRLTGRKRGEEEAAGRKAGEKAEVDRGKGRAPGRDKRILPGKKENPLGERRGGGAVSHVSPAHLIPISFFLAIVLGSILLSLPVASADGKGADLLTAIFTATTSVCVTGLVVVDTYSYFSTFGHVVILILIQIGGIGVIALISLLMLVLGKKFSLGDRRLLKEAFNLEGESGIVRFLQKVVKSILVVEGLGAFFYFLAFFPIYGVPKGLWYAVFHSVSAFCNAGIDLLGSNSLQDFSGSWLVLGNTMVLIILGGLGYVVWFDLLTGMKKGIKKRWSLKGIFSRLSEHTKLVLGLTVFLVLGGMVLILLLEGDNPQTLGGLPLPDKLLGALFQSVTFRTAGFAALPQEKLREVTCLLGYVLMFIGGSPVGTAGGVKTVTVFLVVLNAMSYVGGSSRVAVFRRRVTEDQMRKAMAIVIISFMTVLLMTGVLLLTDQIPLVDASYEVVSALATVGLSRGLTSSLTTAGRLVIIFSMYLGRIGPISMAIFFSRQGKRNAGGTYAPGRFYVG